MTTRHCPSALAAAFLLPGLVAACAPATDGRQESIDALPPGAIAIGDDLYQVPAGEDASGCRRYRLYSPTRLVAQAIYYRAADGGFTMDRDAAACGPDSEPDPARPDPERR